EWQVLDADGLTYRIGRAEQVLAHGFADDRDIGCNVIVRLGEEVAFSKRPSTNVNILRFGAGDAREPIVIPENDLSLRAGSCSGVGHRRALAKDGLLVRINERLGRAPAHVHAAAADGSG